MAQGQRNDKKYPIIEDYIKKNSPMEIKHLHLFIKSTLGALTTAASCRIVARLISRGNVVDYLDSKKRRFVRYIDDDAKSLLREIK